LLWRKGSFLFGAKRRLGFFVGVVMIPIREEG